MSDSEDDVEYELEDFIIGTFPLSITTIAFLPIQTLMANHGKDVEISGQKLWCGSLVVINYLMKFPQTILGSQILELGAGTGVLGMMCKFLGADSIVLTDHDEKSIDHMVQDCERNHVHASVVRFDWKQPNLSLLPLSLDANAELTVVAGDVMYKRDIITPFIDVVDLVLCKYVNSRLLVCHVPRAGVEQSEIVAAFEGRGFSVLCVDIELWRPTTATSSCLDYAPLEDLDRAALYSITKNR